MDIVRTYDTTLADREHGLALRFIAIPAAVFDEDASYGHPETRVHHQIDAAATALDLAVRAEINHPAFINAVLAAVLAAPDGAEAAFALVSDPGIDWESPIAEFASYAAYAEVFAAEESPLGIKSLAGMFSRGKVSAGAALAFVSFGPTPFLFVAVPAAIILVGAATGVSNALEQGLSTLILRKMGVDEGTTSGAGVVD